MSIKYKPTVSWYTPTKFPPSAHVIMIALSWGVLDTVVTYIAAAMISPGAEKNPLMRWALEAGPLAFIGLKAMAVIAIGVILIRGHRHITAVPGWWVWAWSISISGFLHALAMIAVAFGMMNPVTIPV